MLSRKFKIVLALTTLLLLSVVLIGCRTARMETNEPAGQPRTGAFTVELHDTDPDETARILGIAYWKFTLQREPENDIRLTAKLSILSPDEPAMVLDELHITTTETHLDGLVAVYPLDESLFNAEEVRIHIQLGGGSTANVIPNPFSEYSSSYSANPPDLLESGNLRLMAFSNSEPMPGPDNTLLILQIEAADES